ncbi:MAG: DUF1302 family protein [Fodinibius sp.]|nr:DUF1302 family protein [Fodinibius sp.]
MKTLTQLFCIITIVLGPSTVIAQLNATGFIRNYNAFLTQPEHELISGRNRLRLDLGTSFSQGQITISNDIQNTYTNSTDSISYRLREAYVDLYFTSSDLRIGKQIISWGRAEGAFITDILSPVDVTEFLTQDFADLRVGTPAIKYTHYFGSDYLQLIVNPAFIPNNLPSLDNRWFPRLPITTSLPTRIRQSEDANKLKDIQIGGRYALRSNLNYDLDLGRSTGTIQLDNYEKTLEAQFTNVRLNLTESYAQSFIAMYSGS